LARNILEMAEAVCTGTVDFSTMIFDEVATLAMLRAQASMFFTFDAHPLPIPLVLVGVLTEIKIMSASVMFRSISVEKNKFLPRTDSTISLSPGS